MAWNALSWLTGRDPQPWNPLNPVGTETTQSVGMPQPTVYAGPIGQFIDPYTGQLTTQGQARADNPLMNFDTGGLGAMAGRSFLSLERVNPRTMKPVSAELNLDVPGRHAYVVRNPKGDHVGTIDTEWNPDIGELHIADIQSGAGANSLGPGAVKQLRDMLLEQYPDAKTLSGYRITGAGPNRETFQRVVPYQGE